MSRPLSVMMSKSKVTTPLDPYEAMRLRLHCDNRTSPEEVQSRLAQAFGCSSPEASGVQPDASSRSQCYSSATLNLASDGVKGLWQVPFEGKAR
mmetsp:Transcript_31215/g.43437  ORF Transcript_31215/g.43437 Transcript_31215/m.43437 type:complete len:94 (-) Transcript_31215:6-287(-)